MALVHGVDGDGDVGVVPVTKDFVTELALVHVVDEMCMLVSHM